MKHGASSTFAPPGNRPGTCAAASSGNGLSTYGALASAPG